MIARQRGVLNLVWVAVASAALAALAMAAIWSMRYERNLFAEALATVTGAAPASIDAARKAVGAAPAGEGGGALRKCVIAGKTVISNTDCLDNNKTSKAIRITDTRGFEPPKAPAAEKASATSDPAIDKIIEKQLR